MVRILIEHGADPELPQSAEPRDGNRNMLDRVGATPFLLAAKAADVPMMRLLANLGADPNLTTANGATPMMAAAGVGIWKIGENPGTNDEALAAVELTWELGNDVNAVDGNGDTALHGAMHRGADGDRPLPARQGGRPRRGERNRVDRAVDCPGRVLSQHFQPASAARDAAGSAWRGSAPPRAPAGRLDLAPWERR